ncbi:DUF116 domain-containing protein [Candidatus Bipolaricaulota bacterium]|nr:DUF116 domain-containing protein [Candidatus Bipolaricaulota bacterium]
MRTDNRVLNEEEAFARVPVAERVLLLPHCLRPSGDCPGKTTREGLQCPPDCPHRRRCPIGRLRDEAQRLGYKGVCVAPGGALALRFVQELRPAGILAVACYKELVEGVQALAEAPAERPVVLTLPLLRDGCVDTEVDVEKALRFLRLGTPSAL